MSEGNLVVAKGLLGLPQVSYASTRWFHSKVSMRRTSNL